MPPYRTITSNEEPFRNYGLDITKRLESCGFHAEIRLVNSTRNVIEDQKVIIAKKI